MWASKGSRLLGGTEFSAVVAICFLHLLSCAAAQGSNETSWKTLTGEVPVVIAKGGFSGVFPDSSMSSYSFTAMASSSGTILWCDVRLTKDGVGICLPDIKLDNCTSVSDVYPNGKKDYVINGVNTSGWFSVDYNSADIAQLTLRQAIWSRTDRFDSSNYAIVSVPDVVSQLNGTSLWLNVQHDMFYTEHGLSMRNYTISTLKRVVVNYISSPEVNFLAGLSKRVSPKTKLVFRFLDADALEPSTNQTYGSLLKNLTYIKTIAAGILVPKHYIWPVTSDNYLLPHTTLVADAHREGLEVYATDFANDNFLSYNYSFDPLAECLSFIDNGEFSVDGILTDYPITPSEAIGCFSNLNRSSIDHGPPLIISHNGASGDYPDCTDLAYQKAVDDGADVIDCPIQVTEDGVLVCMSSINLMDDTTVAKSQFSTRSSVIPEIQSTPGIFTFNLTWDEINKNLKPTISSPESVYSFERNPKFQNAGNFLRLSDFLAFSKDKDLSGVLISIENAAFAAAKLGVGIIDAVIAALHDAGYSNQTTVDVMIQSPDSSVLEVFKQRTKYKGVYLIKEVIRDLDTASLADIKKFADAVAIDKQSIFPLNIHFITRQTNAVQHLQAANLSVYAYVFRNEFVSQPWDFFSDATVEINSFVRGALVDGIITDFPSTARRYKKNSCRSMGNDLPSYMNPVQVGGLLQVVAPQSQPPAIAPFPALSDSDIVEPPLPPVSAANMDGAGRNSSRPTSPNTGDHRYPSSFLAFLSILLCYLAI